MERKLVRLTRVPNFRFRRLRQVPAGRGGDDQLSSTMWAYRRILPSRSLVNERTARSRLDCRSISNVRSGLGGQDE
jgi:hypothetical protein